MNSFHFIAAVAGIVVFFLLISLAQEVNRQWQVQREVQRLEAQVHQQQIAMVELEHLNQYFRTDDYKERLAREKLNYKAPGEQVVLLPDQELAPAAADKPQAQADQPLSIPRLWWNAFFSDPRSL